MPKNLVVCLDGTGAQLRSSANSNVVLLYRLLDLSDPAVQRGYYDPGVGTFAADGAWTPFARWLTRMGGLAFGFGLRKNLGQAYSWLIQNWQPGDRIYIFGFSRGAYTARALVGLLRAVGLLRPGSENLIPYVISSYARRGGEEHIDWQEIHLTSEIFAHQEQGVWSVPVQCLGLWDTVKAVGYLRWEVHWPYTRQLPNARKVLHAVSIDEKRRPFKESLVTARTDGSLEEVWFAGVHTDIGGTFPDDAAKDRAHAGAASGKAARHARLSTITLKWMIERAAGQGLLLRARAVAAACTVDDGFATATLHHNAWAWTLLGTRHRRIPAGASVHSSVQLRTQAPLKYRPDTVNAAWVDEDWAGAPRLGEKS